MANLIRTNDLTYMRAYAAQMLPDTCTVQEETRTPNGAGKWTSAWNTVTGGTLACRLDVLRGRVIQPPTVGGREALAAQFLLSVPWNTTTLQLNRRVVHGAFTYEITQLIDDHSDAVVKQAVLTRID